MFGISGCDAAPSLEMKKRVFNQMTQLVQVFGIQPLGGSVFSRRDDCRHALFFGLSDNRIAVLPFIGNQMLGCHPFDQAASLRAIRCGTLRHKDSERHTMRIHGQMSRGVEPPVVRLMS